MRRVQLAAALCLATLAARDAERRFDVSDYQELGSRAIGIHESVDLSVPFAPAIVRTAGRPVLVYEIHITSFIAVDVALTRLQVLTEAGAPIADHRDADLHSRLGRAGTRRRPERAEIIGSGQRAIAYVWIQLPAASGAPAAIRHRVELDILQPEGHIHAAVEGTATVSANAPVVLDPPLRGSPWTAIYDPLLVGGHRTAIYTIDGKARIPGRFAIDWIRLPPGGTFEREARARPADWNGLGADVLAVADGTVAAAIDDMPDNTDPAAPPITIANASGNYVAIDIGNGRFAFYEHLLHGSVTVRPGARVKRGDVIARLGYSGSSSMGPHLHFHVADSSSLLGAEGLPFVFTRFEQLGAFRSLDALIEGERWLAGGGGAPSGRSQERPGINAVVRFR